MIVEKFCGGRLFMDDNLILEKIACYLNNLLSLDPEGISFLFSMDGANVNDAIKDRSVAQVNENGKLRILGLLSGLVSFYNFKKCVYADFDKDGIIQKFRIGDLYENA